MKGRSRWQIRYREASAEAPADQADVAVEEVPVDAVADEVDAVIAPEP